MENLEAILESEALFTGGDQWCMEFYYHMYGNAVGSLKVYIKDHDGHEELSWTRSGNQGNAWHRALVRIHKDLFQILIKATGGQGSQRQIAIDDITVTQCKNFGKSHKSISPVPSR